MKKTALYLGLFFCKTSLAAGTLIGEMSNMSVDTAGAGGAVLSENASAAYGNPAAMTYLDSNNLSIHAAGMKPVIEYNDANNPAKSSGDAGGFQPYGSVYWVLPVNERLRFGLSLVSPGGSALDYGNQYAGGAALNDVKLAVFQINPALAYRISPQWSIGAGLQIDYAQLAETFAYGLASVEADSWTLGYNVGLLYQLNERHKFGLTYRSKMDHKLNGKGEVRYPPSASDIPIAPEVNVLNAAQAEISGSHGINDRVTLLWSLAYEGWEANQATTIDSSQSAFYIRRDFNDVWRAAMGAQYWLDNNWRLSGGIGYASSPLDDASAQQPDLPVDSQKRIGVGATYFWDKQTSLNVYYSYVDYGHPAINNPQVKMDGQYRNHNQFVGLVYSFSF